MTQVSITILGQGRPEGRPEIRGAYRFVPRLPPVDVRILARTASAPEASSKAEKKELEKKIACQRVQFLVGDREEFVVHFTKEGKKSAQGDPVYETAQFHISMRMTTTTLSVRGSSCFSISAGSGNMRRYWNPKLYGMISKAGTSAPMRRTLGEPEE